MTVKEFIQRSNLIIPAVDQIMAKFIKAGIMCDIDKAKEYQNKMFIRVSDDSLENRSNTLEDLIGKTNINEVGIGSINFRSSIKSRNELLEFASYNDFYKLCLNQQTSEIIQIQYDQEGYEFVAKSFECFLDFLLFYKRWDSATMFENKDISKPSNNEFIELINNGIDKSFAEMFIFNE